MKYNVDLSEGIFLRRYKRFFADIEWQGSTLIAHVANTGSMKGVNVAGRACLFSHSNNPARKLKYTLEMIRAESGSWVGVNTATPNMLVKEALEQVFALRDGAKKTVPLHSSWQHWGGYSAFKPEYKISAETRLDFVLEREGSDRKHFIEVKNVTMAEGKVAMFPDAETTRGQKHLRELMKLVEDGHTAEIVFTIQREDCEHFAPAHDIDSEYARLLQEAAKKGVRITPLLVNLSPQQAALTTSLLKLKL
jgi:sugar fermentation stimulation protein A